MASFPRLILLFAATAGIAALLSTVAPAAAAESTLTIRETAKTAPSTTRHRASRVRIAASNYQRHIDSMRSDLGCSGIWCGRQFVLMVGIAY